MAKRTLVVFILAIFLIVLLVPACQDTSVLAANVVKVSGTCDLISPFDRKIIPAFNTLSQTQVLAKYDVNAVASLKKGQTDLVILGREPQANEIIGLKDYVIAQDAVCVIIDNTSYEGGEYWQNTTDFKQITTLTPVTKTGGIRNLKKEELKQIYSIDILPFMQRWRLNDYYSWQAAMNLDTGTLSDFRTWSKTPKIINPWVRLTPGRFDTQTVFFQSLGLDDNELNSAWTASKSFNYNDQQTESEEEYLAQTYTQESIDSNTTGNFEFKLGFASRRVLSIAFQHLTLKVVPIDGIDPWENVSAVYSGEYPFGRKIHVLVRENASPSTLELLNYLRSKEGQTVLTSTGFLPVP